MQKKNPFSRQAKKPGDFSSSSSGTLSFLLFLKYRKENDTQIIFISVRHLAQHSFLSSYLHTQLFSLSHLNYYTGSKFISPNFSSRTFQNFNVLDGIVQVRFNRKLQYWCYTPILLLPICIIGNAFYNDKSSVFLCTSASDTAQITLIWRLPVKTVSLPPPLGLCALYRLVSMGENIKT